MVPYVLEKNVLDLAIQLLLLILEATRSLESTNSIEYQSIAEKVDKLNSRLLDVFDLNSS